MQWSPVICSQSSPAIMWKVAGMGMGSVGIHEDEAVLHGPNDELHEEP